MVIEIMYVLRLLNLHFCIIGFCNYYDSRQINKSLIKNLEYIIIIILRGI